jgi:hypothetical protein
VGTVVVVAISGGLVAGLVVDESAGEVMVVTGLPPVPAVGPRVVPVVGLTVPWDVDGAVVGGAAVEVPVPSGAVIGSVVDPVVGNGWAGWPPVDGATAVLADVARRP